LVLGEARGSMTKYYDKLIAECDQAIQQAREALDKGVDDATRVTLLNEILEQTRSKAYFEGYASSMIGDGGETRPCPYEEVTPEYERWWVGFDDATEDAHDDLG
jgi:hypothetical protein